MKRYLLLAGATLCAAALPAPANAQTVIAPDNAAPVTTGTTATRTGTTTTIDGGRRVGNNLFHSFTSFSLGTGDTAQWVRSGGDGGTIANIINRITGGSISTIDGRIATQGFDRANFFFINPAGIIFGANASVAVPNAAYFSTANALRFDDGAVFGVTTPNGSAFSMASPTAFGFLGTQGDIVVRGTSATFVGSDTKLGLSAANITIDGATVEPGALDLIALGNTARDVALDNPLVSRFSTGALLVQNSFVSVRPSAMQNALLRANGGRITLTSAILASDSNERSAAGLSLRASDLVLDSAAEGAFQSYLGSFAPGAGNAGAVDIDVLSLTVSETGQISSQALPGATGNAGNIAIRAGSLRVLTGGSITSSAFGESRSGNIDITADSIDIASRGLIEASTFGAGVGGDVLIRTDTLSIDDGTIAAEAELGATGSAGRIGVMASTVELTNGARISSSNAGSGMGGVVEITADTITLRNGARIEVDAIGATSGGAGAVFASGRIIRVESGSEISSVTEGSGDAGAVVIEADALLIDGGTINSAALGGTGAAGLVDVDANALDIRNGGAITSSTAGSGTAGLIQIAARAITLQTGGRIASETSGIGRAGDIVIGPRNGVAPDISITSNGQISSSQEGEGATGDAGTITIDAGRLFLGPARTPGIRTDVFGGGNAGAIAITARSVELDAGQITSSNGFLPGVSGSITIAADTITLRNGAQIDTTSFNADQAGAIRLTTGTLSASGSGIRSENTQSVLGNAGSILIEANRIELLDGAGISTDSLTGAAGDITLLLPRTGTLLLRGVAISGFITTSSGPGTGGIITIASPFLILSDGGQITALGQSFGADVLLQSDFFIRSADRLNLLSVDGLLLVDSQVGDLSAGAEPIDLSFLDAASVLRDQCSGARGGTNRLNLRAIGPYAGAALSGRDRPATIAAANASSQWRLCRQ